MLNIIAYAFYLLLLNKVYFYIKKLRLYLKIIKI